MIQATITSTISLGILGLNKNPMVAQARKENRFSNPDYVNALRLGRYLGGMPQFIHVWQEDLGILLLPRGYGKRLAALGKEMRQPINWVDRRVTSPAMYPAKIEGIDFRGYQDRAVNAAMGTSQGVIVAPTGSGKTLAALELIRRRAQRAVILVHSQALARQWRKVIQKAFPGIHPGMIGDGEWYEGKEITVAIMQTLSSRPEAARAFASRIGLAVVDEAHHAPSGTFAEVISMFPGKYRYGFTATPKRGDGLGEVINRLIGDTVATIHPDEVEDLGGIVPARVLAVDTGIRFPQVNTDSKTAWTDLMSLLAQNTDRNALIARIVIDISRQRQTLILTDRVAHAEAMAKCIPGALLVHGSIADRNRRMIEMKTARVTIGTRGLLGEGLDVSVWSALVVASPISGETPLLQGVGRVIRPAPGKKEGLVVDIVDAHPFLLSSWHKRRAIYNGRGWQIEKGGWL